MSNKDIHLVAFYHLKPKNPNKTKDAGYMTNPDNIAMDESINITRGLKTRDQLSARVILNLSKETVVRNTFNDGRDYASLLAHYQEGYPQYINPLLAQLYPEEVNGNVNVSNQEEEKSS